MHKQLTTPIRVRLKTDLTQYDQHLTPGREGYTIGVHGKCSQLSARYIGVWFPGIRLLDVSWASLEVVDEQQLVRQVKEHREKRRSLRLARNMNLAGS